MIYPNPVMSDATARFTQSYSTRVAATVYNIKGQVVKNLFDSNIEADVGNSIAFSTSNMIKGCYIVKLTTDKEIQTQIIVVK